MNLICWLKGHHPLLLLLLLQEYSKVDISFLFWSHDLHCCQRLESVFLSIFSTGLLYHTFSRGQHCHLYIISWSRAINQKKGKVEGGGRFFFFKFWQQTYRSWHQTERGEGGRRRKSWMASLLNCSCSRALAQLSMGRWGECTHHHKKKCTMMERDRPEKVWMATSPSSWSRGRRAVGSEHPTGEKQRRYHPLIDNVPSADGVRHAALLRLIHRGRGEGAHQDQQDQGGGGGGEAGCTWFFFLHFAKFYYVLTLPYFFRVQGSTVLIREKTNINFMFFNLLIYFVLIYLSINFFIRSCVSFSLFKISVVFLCFLLRRCWRSACWACWSWRRRCGRPAPSLSASSPPGPCARGPRRPSRPCRPTRSTPSPTRPWPRRPHRGSVSDSMTVRPFMAWRNHWLFFLSAISIYVCTTIVYRVFQ